MAQQKVNALLKQFVDLVGADLTAAGFVRRGPVWRRIDGDGNGIAVDIQRTTALWGEVEFFVNVGVLAGPYLRHLLGDRDPLRDAMPHHGVWEHRIVATDDTAELPDHRFSLAGEADVDRAATIVRTWFAANLDRMTGWLGDYDAMLAAMAEDRERSERASAEQLATGVWRPGRWPDGGWYSGIVEAYAYADRGDVEGATTATAGADSLAADVLALAARRRAEGRG